MEALDLAMIIFIAAVAIFSAIGFFRSYKDKEDK
jgi:hypothetical protein